MVEGKKLTITSATESDEGLYSCNILPYTYISLKFNLAIGTKHEVVYEGKSGASVFSETGALIMATIVAAVFLRI